MYFRVLAPISGAPLTCAVFMADTAKSDEQAEEQQADAVAEDRREAEQLADGDDAIEDDTASELARLREQIASQEDQVLRARAEADNIQRRAARDVENAHKYGVERLVRDLIPVVDSLEKAVEIARKSHAEDEGADAQGIELASKLLVDTLARHGIERILPEGEPFDPAWHEAVAMAPDDNCEENTIVNVVQSGFSLNGRLVRAAKVVVSRAEPA